MLITSCMTHIQAEVRSIERTSGLVCSGWVEIGSDIPGQSILVPVFTKTPEPAQFTIEAIEAEDSSDKYANLTYKQAVALSHQQRRTRPPANDPPEQAKNPKNATTKRGRT